MKNFGKTIGYSVLNFFLKPLKKILSLRLLPHNMLNLKHRLFEFLGREPIIVYTMGKVGSATVFHAFHEQYFFPLTYHVHHLTSKAFQNAVKKYNESGLQISDKINLTTLIKGNSSHMSASQILMNPKVINTRRNWNIITLVRDPFSTYLSHIFQNPQIRRPFLLDENGMLNKEKVERHIDEIFTKPHPEKDFISNWFDNEFYKFTGVDLYQYPFNPEKGYAIIHEKRFKIAVIALESLDKNLPLIFKEFTNSSEEISIEKKNIRTRDDKSGFYQELKNNIKVPRDGLEKFYSTKYARYFFTTEYREQMINKWSGTRINDTKVI